MKRSERLASMSAKRRASGQPSLTRSGRLKPVSRKVRRERPAFDAVYAQVDARSGGWCEVVLRGAACSENGIWQSWRCGARATDHCHTRKPRRSWHAPEWIWHGCRFHHRMDEAAYASRRLVVTPHGDGTFTFRLVYAANKFTARAGA